MYYKSLEQSQTDNRYQPQLMSAGPALIGKRQRYNEKWSALKWWRHILGNVEIKVPFDWKSKKCNRFVNDWRK